MIDFILIYAPTMTTKIFIGSDHIKSSTVEKNQFSFRGELQPSISTKAPLVIAGSLPPYKFS